MVEINRPQDRCPRAGLRTASCVPLCPMPPVGRIPALKFRKWAACTSTLPPSEAHLVAAPGKPRAEGCSLYSPWTERPPGTSSACQWGTYPSLMGTGLVSDWSARTLGIRTFD